MTTELLLGFSNILAAHVLGRATVLPPTNALMGEQMAKNMNSPKLSVSAFGGEVPAVILETSSEFAVRVFLRKASLQNGYKRNEAQGSKQFSGVY